MTQMLTAGLDNVQLLRDRRIELLPGLWPTRILTHEHEQAAANASSTPRQRLANVTSLLLYAVESCAVWLN
jgi:hypothetical protein